MEVAHELSLETNNDHRLVAEHACYSTHVLCHHLGFQALDRLRRDVG
jgi:hypothetical protein